VGGHIHPGRIRHGLALLTLLATASAALWFGPEAGAAGGSGGGERDVCAPAAPRHTCPGEPDFEPPETKILLAPTDTRSRTATFQFFATEKSTFVCALDGRQKFKPCVSPLTFRVDRGRHTFRVTATDTAGNVDQTPAIASWRVKKRRH
jgi:hypothetical protein